MSVEPFDLLVRIRGRGGATAYPVEAELSDGSRFTGSLTIDPAAPAPDGQDEAYGRQLFDALFAGQIRTAYDKAVAAAPGGLRIRLQIDPEAVELEVIRWERIYRERNGTWIPLSTAGDTPFSRYRARPAAEPRPVATLPLRILLAVSNPKVLPPGFQAVEVHQEVKTFYDALGPGAETDEVDVTVLARRADLGPTLCARLDGGGNTIVDGRTTLTEFVRRLAGSHIVHFVGHGNLADDPDPGGVREAALFFEADEGDKFDPVTGAQLVTRFAAAEPTPSLVYLSACESGLSDTGGPHPFLGIAPRLIDAGVAAVVAMQDRIPVEAAGSMTTDFYQTLFSTGLVDAAVNRARSVLFDEQLPAWTIPILFTRLHRGRLLVEHALANRVISDDVMLLPEPEHGAVADRVASVPVPHLRPAPVLLLPRDFPDLLGREDDVKGALAAVSAGSVAEFYGPSGSGKTALLRYLANRAGAATGASVVHIPNGGEPVQDLLQYLFDALYEADASLRPTDADLRRYLAGCETVIAVDDADVPQDAIGKLVELVPKGRFVFAAVERNLWGEGSAEELEGLRGDAAVQLFERGLGRHLTADERPQAEALCASLGGIPLHILQAADRVAKGTLTLTPAPAAAAAPTTPAAMPPPATEAPTPPAAPEAPTPPAEPATPTTSPSPPASEASPPAATMQTGAIDALSGPERQALGVIAAAGAPIRLERIEAVIGQPDASATCESLRKAGLIRTASPRYTLAEALPPGYEVSLGVADWRKRLLAHLVRWVGQNRRSPGVLLRDLDVILAAIDRADDAADAAQVLELARGTESALILSKRWVRWDGLLDREATLAAATKDDAALGWVRHQQGSRALALRDEDAAKARLTEALQIRERLGDTAGAAVTRHNLQLLGALPPPDGDHGRDPHRGTDPHPPPRWLRPPLVFGVAGALILTGVLVAKVAVDVVHSRTAEVPGNFAPLAQLAPDHLELGTVEIGGSSEAALVVTNAGNEDLTVSDIALEPPVTDLTITTDCLKPVPADKSCAISVLFTPTAAGDRGTTLTFDDNTADGSHALPVTAQGATPAGVPALEIKPPALDFGVVPQGTAAQQEVAVVSSGTADVLISGVVPPDSADFAIVGDDCSRQTLTPGKGCAIQVAFQPSGPGDRKAVLTIIDSTAEGRHDIALIGSGKVGLPDLQTNFDLMQEPFVEHDGSIVVPVIVVVRNEGDADAAPFSIRGELLDPQVDQTQILPTGLTPDPDFGVEPDGFGGVRTTAPMPPGSAMKFTGRLTIGPERSGRTIQLSVEADSCLGLEIFDDFTVAHCAIEESDEKNNRSNVIDVLMPVVDIITDAPTAVRIAAVEGDGR